ncbi:MAG: hypothetical protein AB7O65_14300 [Candidatus Korobacteraceae bacterium]
MTRSLANLGDNRKHRNQCKHFEPGAVGEKEERGIAAPMTPATEAPKTIRRLTPAELDAKASRMKQLEAEADELRAELLYQVQAFGSVPPRAEKSRRLETDSWKLTASVSQRVEVHDKEVQSLKQVCEPQVFECLFSEVIKYNVARGAMALLSGVLPEGSPRNLRKLFHQAVTFRESSPSLKLDRKDKE